MARLILRRSFSLHTSSAFRDSKRLVSSLHMFVSIRRVIILVIGLIVIVCTQHDIAILSGEGMLALWGALKSVLRPGDIVVSVCNGIYGDGIADMAGRLGAVVHKVMCSDHRSFQPRSNVN